MPPQPLDAPQRLPVHEGVQLQGGQVTVPPQPLETWPQAPAGQEVIGWQQVLLLDTHTASL